MIMKDGIDAEYIKRVFGDAPEKRTSKKSVDLNIVMDAMLKAKTKPSRDYSRNCLIIKNEPTYHFLSLEIVDGLFISAELKIKNKNPLLIKSAEELMSTLVKQRLFKTKKRKVIDNNVILSTSIDALYDFLIDADVRVTPIVKGEDVLYGLTFDINARVDGEVLARTFIVYSIESAMGMHIKAIEKMHSSTHNLVVESSATTLENIFNKTRDILAREFEDAQIKMTIASTAMCCATQMMDYNTCIKSTSSRQIELLRSALVPGFTYMQSVNVYEAGAGTLAMLDFKAAYPFIMKGPLPHGQGTPGEHVHFIDVEDTVKNPYDINTFQVIECRVHCNESVSVPFLSRKHDEIGRIYRGTFDCTTTNLELSLARGLGYTVEEVYSTLTFREFTPFMSNFVNKVEELESELADSDTFKKYLKALRNSGYGKLADRGILTKTTRDPSVAFSHQHPRQYAKDEEIYLYNEESKFFRVSLVSAVYISSLSRVRLITSMNLLPKLVKSTIIYSDTDSLVIRSTEKRDTVSDAICYLNHKIFKLEEESYGALTIREFYRNFRVHAIRKYSGQNLVGSWRGAIAGLELGANTSHNYELLFNAQSVEPQENVFESFKLLDSTIKYTDAYPRYISGSYGVYDDGVCRVAEVHI